ncbi:MAG: sel1 repeat family protein, partial [Methylococcales bacterium]|nr:sel1 repeat family protein [Methylococcales bacterium]
YSKAAEQGHTAAQSNLGIMYASGKGVSEDYKKSVYWYGKAAEQGHASAQYNLGVMYFHGKGVPQDYVRAHMFFKIAGANGEKEGVKQRGLIAELMTLSQIAEAERLAGEWMQKHQ